jgi:hypothetical protein
VNYAERPRRSDQIWYARNAASLPKKERLLCLRQSGRQQRFSILKHLVKGTYDNHQNAYDEYLRTRFSFSLSSSRIANLISAMSPAIWYNISTGYHSSGNRRASTGSRRKRKPSTGNRTNSETKPPRRRYYWPRTSSFLYLTAVISYQSFRNDSKR